MNRITYLINHYTFMIMVALFINKSENFQFLQPVESGPKIDLRRTMSFMDSISSHETKNNRESIEIDLNRPLRQQTIVIRNSEAMKINLLCRIIKPVTLKKKEIVTQLCYQASILQNVICLNVSTTVCQTNMFHMTMSMKDINNETGYQIMMESIPMGDNDLSGYYYCRSSSVSSGLVLSNVLEIRDLIYWEKNIIPSPRQIVSEHFKQDLDATKMPKSFSCLEQVKSFILRDIPYWIELEFESIVKWAWCPVTKQRPNLLELERSYMEECLTQTISKCHKAHHLCPYSSHQMPGWKEHIAFDGTITLISGQKFPDYGNKLDGYALMCYYRSRDNYKPLKYIAQDYGEREIVRGLQWINRVNDRSTNDVISPMIQTIRVGILKKDFTLTAFYYPSSYFTYEWRRNGRLLHNSTEWFITQYSLQYRLPVSFESEGEYHLQVKSGHQETEFIFNVIVSSPPYIVKASVNAISSSVFAMVGSDVSISYQYAAKPSNLFIYINGLVYIPGVSDHTVFINDLTRTFLNLKDLKFNVTKRDHHDNMVTLVYSVTNVSFSATKLPQDHSLIIEARNSYGISRTHLNVNVLKFPTYKKLPIIDNCSIPCSSQRSHLFRCEINQDYYVKKNVVVEKFWTVNNMRLDTMPFYSTFFKQDSKGLYLSALNSNISEHVTGLKLLFRKANLLCRIRLLYPDSIGLSEEELIRDKRIIFDTLNDQFFMRYSTAVVTLDLEPPTANASYTWVVFVMIVLLLIVMFVFLLVRLALRDQVKSYQMEPASTAQSTNSIPRHTISGMSSVFSFCSVPQNRDQNHSQGYPPATTNDLTFKEKIMMCLSQNHPRLASINLEKLDIVKGVSRDEEMNENETLESYVRPNSPENGMNLSANKALFVDCKQLQTTEVVNDFDDINSLKTVHS